MPHFNCTSQHPLSTSVERDGLEVLGLVERKINGIKELRLNGYTDGKAKTGLIELYPINLIDLITKVVDRHGTQSDVNGNRPADAEPD
jgi:hypothetical protein